MIVKLDHETGEVIETSIAHFGGFAPDEIARGLFSVLERVTRVRVWEDGGSLTDPPAADVTRDDAGRQDDPHPSRTALVAWFAECLCAVIQGLGVERPEDHEQGKKPSLVAFARLQQPHDFQAPV
jgi:hypothetical protein